MNNMVCLNWVISYNIMKKYWNQGLTTEVAKAILEFGMDKLQIVKFLGRHARENSASGKVMEKAGFIYHRDGSYTSFDGQRKYKSREYLLEIR